MLRPSTIYCFTGVPLLTMKIMKLLKTLLTSTSITSFASDSSSPGSSSSRAAFAFARDPGRSTRSNLPPTRYIFVPSSNQPGPPPPSFTSGELLPTFPCSEFFHPTLAPQKVLDLGIPSNFTLLCPVPERDRIEDIDSNHIVIYEDSLEASLRIPFHPLVCDFLDKYCILPVQIPPNSRRILLWFILICHRPALRVESYLVDIQDVLRITN
ncbi:PREDICTED: uncharacterized protein LOC105119881 [Populus euphratica]|uniref:Uncharacterized protein LOC105119881 n=1 Tax=Populus euphratica TaxID=75702 RepID=A0AAJ6TRU8_POPEU|nr:PREDICTED: uncharacterized protein LOC105119881 [Populus euphratica]